MSPRILRVLVLLALVSTACLAAGLAQARTATADIARLRTGIATLERVQVRLDWPKAADRGALQLRAGRLVAPALGYDFRDIVWRCPLQRALDGGWRCEGEIRGGSAPPMRLSLDLSAGYTDVSLRRGEARIDVHRVASAPDDTRIDLVRVPLAWTQALLARAWRDGRLKGGTADAALTVSAPSGRPLRVAGPLTLHGAALETPDATIAAEHLGGRFDLDMRFGDRDQRIDLRGELQGGELLLGSTYIALPATPVGLRVGAVGDAHGWRLPTLQWRDGNAFAAQGQAALAPDGSLRGLDVDLDSRNLSPLAERYLSAWLGSFGLSRLQLQGDLHARVHLDAQGVRGVDAHFGGVSVIDPDGRFRFDGIEGDLRFSGGEAVDSLVGWRGGQLYGLEFGAAALPLRSADGALALREPIAVPAVGGQLQFERFRLQPAFAGRRTEAAFSLAVDDLDVGKLAKSLGWPAFQGNLSGRIPDAHYVDDRLNFEGGLDMRVFDGSIQVASLSMERPFGVAPTLSADLTLKDLDLLAVTRVFDFGSISGRLDGRIADLRLVDWTATAFDAELHTVPRRGVRQRISQRAVQNISSVGDASFVSSLQGKLIGLFDDFGYRRIGIACRLQNQICAMGGLAGASGSGSETAGSTGAANAGFTIVEGAGVPRLNVVGFHRRVDWPTLVERLEAVGSGDLTPVVE